MPGGYLKAFFKLSVCLECNFQQSLIIKQNLGNSALNTLLVLIFEGTYFRGDRNDRISRVYIFSE